MWPDHCVQNTQGAKLHPELLTGESDKKIYKGTVRTVDSYSGFGDAFGHQYEKTSLENDLHNAGVKNVFICGELIALACKVIPHSVNSLMPNCENRTRVRLLRQIHMY